jgi:hypothetical protein
MTSLDIANLNRIEERICMLKKQLSQISEECSTAGRSKKSNTEFSLRLRASEKMLENSSAMVSYVEVFSPPVANQIRVSEEHARKAFKQIELTNDSEELQKWIKSLLIPSIRLSESLAHLAASSVRKMQGIDEFHIWQLKRLD